jgi:hypothetical protein
LRSGNTSVIAIPPFAAPRVATAGKIVGMDDIFGLQ